MIPSVTIECSKCKQKMVVIPPTLGQVRPPGDPIPTADVPDVPEGSKLVEADEVNASSARCPTCGEENVVAGLI